MDSANLHGQMDKYMLETMSMDLDMEKASTALSFKEGTKVSGKQGCSLGRGNIVKAMIRLKEYGSLESFWGDNIR